MNNTYHTSKDKKGRELVIRDISIQDAQELYNLGKKEKYFCGFWQKDVLENISRDENAIGLVATVDGKIKGFEIMNYSPTFRKAVIENAYVQEGSRLSRFGQYQNKPISRCMTTIAKWQARKKGARRIDSLIDSENIASLNFAKRNGFEQDSKKYSWVSKDWSYKK